MRLKVNIVIMGFCLTATILATTAIALSAVNGPLAELHHELATKRLEAMRPLLASYQQKLDELSTRFRQEGNEEKAREAQEEKALIEAELARLIKAEEETRVPAVPVPVASSQPSQEQAAVKRVPKTYVSSTRGLAGAASFSENNVYEFTLPEVGPVSTLTFYATGRRSLDSVGNVWLLTPTGEREKVLKWKENYFKDPSTEVESYKKLKPIREDISEYVKVPGTYRVEFEWTGGIDPLVVYRVEITS